MPQNPLLLEIQERGRVSDANGVERDPFPHSSPPAATDGLYQVVRDLEARSTLEVGLAFGLSTLAICQPHLERGSGHHVAIDPEQVRIWGGIGVLNARRAGLSDYFEHLGETSERALPRLWAEGHRLDFAFIDGLHLFDHCLLDFFYIDRMLDVGGVVAIDDLWMPAMRKVVAFARTNRGYERLDAPEVGRGARQRLFASGRRLMQSAGELGLDRSGYVARGTNVAFLRKTRDDARKWHHYAPF